MLFDTDEFFYNEDFFNEDSVRELYQNMELIQTLCGKVSLLLNMCVHNTENPNYLKMTRTLLEGEQTRILIPGARTT